MLPALNIFTSRRRKEGRKEVRVWVLQLGTVPRVSAYERVTRHGSLNRTCLEFWLILKSFRDFYEVRGEGDRKLHHLSEVSVNILITN